MHKILNFKEPLNNLINYVNGLLYLACSIRNCICVKCFSFTRSGGAVIVFAQNFLFLRVILVQAFSFSLVQEIKMVSFDIFPVQPALYSSVVGLILLIISNAQHTNNQ